MPADSPIYKCGDCGSTNIVIEIPPSPWDEHPEDYCFHQAPNKPQGVVGFVHPKSEPCSLLDKPDPVA